MNNTDNVTLITYPPTFIFLNKLPLSKHRPTTELNAVNTQHVVATTMSGH